MRALLGVFLFFFIAFIVLLLMLVRFMLSLSSRNQINRQRQRHRQHYHQQGSTIQKDGVEVIDTRTPEARDKKVIPDNEGEYVEPIEE